MGSGNLVLVSSYLKSTVSVWMPNLFHSNWPLQWVRWDQHSKNLQTQARKMPDTTVKENFLQVEFDDSARKNIGRRNGLILT